jgi:hypothetical protein
MLTARLSHSASGNWDSLAKVLPKALGESCKAHSRTVLNARTLLVLICSRNGMPVRYFAIFINKIKRRNCTAHLLKSARLPTLEYPISTCEERFS